MFIKEKMPVTKATHHHLPKNMYLLYSHLLHSLPPIRSATMMSSGLVGWRQGLPVSP